MLYLLLLPTLTGCSDPPPPPSEDLNRPIGGRLDTGGSEPVASSGGGKRAKSDGNSAPRLRDIYFEPEEPRSIDSLTVKFTAKDPNGDRVKMDFKWFVNGEQVMGQEKKTLNKKFFEKGDEVSVELEASDGRKEITRKSDPIEILNSPPEITIPRYGVDNIDGLQIQASDPDGDTLRFRLEDAPPGLTINSTGELSFASSMEQTEGGTFPTRIIAEDPEGEYSAWEMKLTLNPSKP